MKQIYLPSRGPEDWRRYLALPDRHWRDGFSAKMAAYRWEEAAGFPVEIAALFEASEESVWQGVELLLAIPEYKVPMPGHGKPSQNDLFALAKNGTGDFITIVIEAMVHESFGPTVGQWMAPSTNGRQRRLEGLSKQLGLEEIPTQLRYQLVHRTASAVIEAQRFNAPSAAMIVHSFSTDDRGFGDYSAFLGLFGAEAGRGRLVFLTEISGVMLYAGWANGSEPTGN